MSVRHNVLIIMTADPRLVAAEDIARRLGHFVYLHESPVGAGNAITRNDIDVAILSWNAGVEQDRKLLSLIESWQRMRSLKVVVLTATRVASLTGLMAGRPDVSVIESSRLERLPDVLGKTSGEMKAVSMPDRGGLFVDRLRQRLEEASQNWDNIAQGGSNYRRMDFLLGGAQGQAQMLDFDRLDALLSETRTVVAECAAHGRPMPAQYDAVAAALRFSVHISSAPPYDADCDITPLKRRLRQSIPRRR